MFQNNLRLYQNMQLTGNGYAESMSARQHNTALSWFKLISYGMDITASWSAAPSALAIETEVIAWKAQLPFSWGTAREEVRSHAQYL